MVAIMRFLELGICAAFYAGIGFMIFDGAVSQMRKIGHALFPEPRPHSLVVVSAIHDKPCMFTSGDYLNYLSMVNKQDFAQIHEFKVITTSKIADPTLQGSWNKIGWLLKAYDDFSDTEWLMWIDSDTMITSPSFKLPLDKFAGKDLVIAGNATAIGLGDGAHGVNTGVMLVRRTEWARNFLVEVAKLGRMQEPQLGNLIKSELNAKGYEYDEDAGDQNAVIYVLKKAGKDLRKHVALAGADFCFNCDWHDLLEPAEAPPEEFIAHFHGCRLCTSDPKADDMADACEAEWLKTAQVAQRRAGKLLPRAGTRSPALHKALADTPYCKFNGNTKECLESSDALQEASLQADSSLTNAHRRLLSAASAA